MLLFAAHYYYGWPYYFCSPRFLSFPDTFHSPILRPACSLSYRRRPPVSAVSASLPTRFVLRFPADPPRAFSQLPESRLRGSGGYTRPVKNPLFRVSVLLCVSVGKLYTENRGENSGKVILGLKISFRSNTSHLLSLLPITLEISFALSIDTCFFLLFFFSNGWAPVLFPSPNRGKIADDKCVVSLVLLCVLETTWIEPPARALTLSGEVIPTIRVGRDVCRPRCQVL